MKPAMEVELKFQVPAASRAPLAAEMQRGKAAPERISLAASYLDTPDRRLARAGLAWRLRREGRQWVQTLKAAGATALERFEHDAPRTGPVHDAFAHAGTGPGDRLIEILQQARGQGLEPRVRYATEVRRTLRRIRTRGAVVEVALDEGHLSAGGVRLPIREIEFELVSGSPTAMLALAERWRRRFGLVLDPRSKAERGDRLAEGHRSPAVRHARAPQRPDGAGPLAAVVSAIDEGLSQVMHNAIGLIDGDASLGPAHASQLCEGIRRVLEALNDFEGPPSPIPADLVEGLRSWRDALEQCEQARARARDVAALCRSERVQALLLAWITWLATLQEGRAAAAASSAPD